MSWIHHFRRRFRRHRRVLLWIGAGFVLVLIACEIGLRCFLGNNALGELLVIQSDEPCNLGLRPDTSVTHTGLLTRIPPVVISVNHFGYRGQPRPPEKSDGVYRIVIVGDSFTFCPGVAEGSDYPSQLEKELRSRHPSVEVLNFGIPSANLEQNERHLVKDALAYHPDLVIVQIAQNDFSPPLCQVLRRMGIPSIRLVTRSYLMRIAITLFIISTENYESMDCFDQKQRFVHFARDIQRATRQSGVNLLVTSFEVPVQCAQESVEEQFDKQHIPYMPFPKALDDHLCVDKGHLDAEGCHDYALVLAKKIEDNFQLP